MVEHSHLLGTKQRVESSITSRILQQGWRDLKKTEIRMLFRSGGIIYREKRWRILMCSELHKQLVLDDLQNKLCAAALPERTGWVEALDCEGWVGEGLGNGGHLGPVLRCCHPS